MMTLEQSMERVTREIDALWVKHQDGDLLRMVEAGLDPDDVAEHVAEQREAHLVWRTKTLAEVRITLRAAMLEPW